MANKSKPKQKKNFFDKLKKTFSSDVIIRRTSRFGLKVLDPDGTQHYSTNMRDRYHRLFYSRTAQNSGGIARQVMLSIQNQRIAFFRDYEIMNRDPIIASALDIFSEEASLKDETGRVLDIRSSSSEVKEVLENLFYDVLNIEFNLAPWIHAACMYGDFFLWLEIVKDYGIVGVRPLSVYDTIRHEGENPDNPKEVYFTTMGISGREETLDNYEVVHFRIESDTNFYPYGRSIIEPARRVFKQLYLVEDAMLIHRIMRAPQKRIFKIDVGNIPPKDIENEINKIVNETKKIPVQDEQTGDYNLRYNMQSLIEDYYLPVRGKDHGTSIDTLTGLEYNGIEDVTYLLNKMFAALKVPKAFLTYDADTSGKTSVSSQDIKFARTVEKIQRAITSELIKIAVIHLKAQGFEGENLCNFELSLTPPSTIYENEKITLWRERIALASDAKSSNLFSDKWIYETIVGFSRDEYERERELMVDDKKRTFRYSQIEQGNPDPSHMDPMSQQQMPNQFDPSQGLGMPGRPESGMVYGQDSHPRGRDPLSAQSKQFKMGKQTLEQKKLLPPSSEKGTYMSEEIIIEEHEIEFLDY